MNYEELYKFKKNKNGYTLESYLMKNSAEITELEIPSEYRSIPVTEIGNYAFSNAKYPRSVIIPDSVRELGSGVFMNCTSLAAVKLPKEITGIPPFMFDGCSSLKNIDLPDSVTAIHDGAFDGCEALEEVILPKNLKLLDSTFIGCTSLRSVVFQSEVNVTPFTFDDCPLLPAETVVLSLVPNNDITEPFISNNEVPFNGIVVLRRDVFELAIKNDSLSKMSKDTIFICLFDGELFAEYYPIMRENGWLYRRANVRGFEKMLTRALFDRRYRDIPELWEHMEWWAADEKLLDGIFTLNAYKPKMNNGLVLWEKLLERSVKYSKTEVTAWLLEYKNRRFGFNGGDNFEL